MRPATRQIHYLPAAPGTDLDGGHPALLDGVRPRGTSNFERGPLAGTPAWPSARAHRMGSGHRRATAAPSSRHRRTTVAPPPRSLVPEMCSNGHGGHWGAAFWCYVLKVMCAPPFHLEAKQSLAFQSRFCSALPGKVKCADQRNIVSEERSIRKMQFLWIRVLRFSDMAWPFVGVNALYQRNVVVDPLRLTI